MVESLGMGSVGAEDQREPLMLMQTGDPLFHLKTTAFQKKHSQRLQHLPLPKQSTSSSSSSSSSGVAVQREEEDDERPIFDMYLFILGNKSNRWVGDAESLSGIVALLVAAPVGILVDKCSRGNICKVTCVMGMVAAACSVWGLSVDSLSGIILSLIIWGVFWEASNSATNALFTDSLVRGDRTQWFSWRAVVRNTSNAMGPFLMIAFFEAYGDAWEMKRVRQMLLLGTFIFAPSSSVLLWFFADVTPEGALAASSADGAAEGSEAAAQPQGDDDPLSSLSPLHRSVPYVISVSDFVRSMGAGMAVKFFPLFFSNQYHLTPIQLCQLGVAYALSIVFFIFVAEKLAKVIGRASASQLLSLLGLIMLVTMCVVRKLPFVILAHLVRGGMQNAIYPIDRSIVMDFTKSKDRGKWSAVETFTSTMWSGSAFLGGMMADTDYRYNIKYPGYRKNTNLLDRKYTY
ncbi:hypothetical protein Esti_003887 [Eimeria stiedai]